MTRYRDRADAGRVLAGHLAHHGGARPLVLGLAGGGVVVAAEVAARLPGDLGAVVVVRLEAPEGTGLAVGAVTADGVPLIEEQLAARLGLSTGYLAEEVRRGTAEARRRQRRYGPARGPDPAGRSVLVVDDGVATGIALRAVLRFVRRGRPAFLGAAVPVGLPAVVDLVAAEADEVVCPRQPLRLHSVGEWYEDFPEVADDEAAALLVLPASGR